MGFGVEGLGFGVKGVEGGFVVWGVETWTSSTVSSSRDLTNAYLVSRVGIYGLRFRVQGFGFRVEG